ncbi:hypothetical protein SBDP1_1090010 [Syntrophobacter sp. SbD1]|nr:hypothetical protein SBDP1_1090010 [Syntrophobacter sp. SbD1]
MILRWVSDLPRTDSLNKHQAGLLAHGSLYSPVLPISKDSGFTGFRPRSQRRDRSRF